MKITLKNNLFTFTNVSGEVSVLEVNATVSVVHIKGTMSVSEVNETVSILGISGKVRF